MPPAAMDAFLERLARGKPIPAIVLLGSDAYLREMCRKRIIEAFVPEGMRDWAVTRISVRDAGWEEVVQRAQTLPMMSPSQVILVDQVESFEKLGDKSRDAIVAMLNEYLSSPAPFTVLVLEASALDRRQRLFKVLSEKALMVELTIGGESAAVLATQMAKDVGVQIDREAAAQLVDTLNGEPARMHIEVQKLATYALDRGRITAADVNLLVVAARRNTVWQFADMLASRRRDAALAFLDNLLREGEQPAGIVGALAWSYRNMIEGRTMGPFQTAARISKKQLLEGLIALAEADSQLKSSNPDPRAFMEFLVARLTAPA